MKKTKTIYYLPKYGQLGNQLAVLAHLLAFAIDFDYTIVHFASASLLHNLDEDKIKKGPVRFSKLLTNHIFSYFINKANKIIFLNGNRRFAKGLFLNAEYNVDRDISTKELPTFIVITHWLFRYYSGVIKHQQLLRTMLSFRESLLIEAKQVLQAARNNFPLHTLVGVHIRRGDYATFLNGKYFYSDAVFYDKMKYMAEQLGNCVFIICSNEEINFENNSNLQIIYTKGSPAEDIFLLSNCKFIFGPPSTFSSWAAFLGHQKFLSLEDKSDDVSLDKFNHYFL